jgi:hypothetical protein
MARRKKHSPEQLENAPRIMGKSLETSALAEIFGVLAGGEISGIVGARGRSHSGAAANSVAPSRCSGRNYDFARLCVFRLTWARCSTEHDLSGSPSVLKEKVGAPRITAGNRQASSPRARERCGRRPAGRCPRGVLRRCRTPLRAGRHHWRG